MVFQVPLIDIILSWNRNEWNKTELIILLHVFLILEKVECILRINQNNNQCTLCASICYSLICVNISVLYLSLS